MHFARFAYLHVSISAPHRQFQNFHQVPKLSVSTNYEIRHFHSTTGGIAVLSKVLLTVISSSYLTVSSLKACMYLNFKLNTSLVHGFAVGRREIVPNILDITKVEKDVTSVLINSSETFSLGDES